LYLRVHLLKHALKAARNLSIAQAKDTFSEVINQAAFGHERVIICRHGKPVAAVAGLDEVEEPDRLRCSQSPGNLASIAGQWEGFDEIASTIDEAVALRQSDAGRDVSLE